LNEEHNRVARFQVLLSEPDLFRAEVLGAIALVREVLKLPPAEADLYDNMASVRPKLRLLTANPEQAPG
jgi:hypothetical protein